jgi:hypothetical protein
LSRTSQRTVTHMLLTYRHFTIRSQLQQKRI